MNERVRAIDWLRGLAVVVMVQTHALSLLLPSLRTGPFFAQLQWIDVHGRHGPRPGCPAGSADQGQ